MELTKPSYASIALAMQAQIPILIPCFETVTYVQSMVEQLRVRGFENILLVDNCSTYPPMRSYLAAPGHNVLVISQEENTGPRSIFANPNTLSLLPQFFCISDPDLLLNSDMPIDFVAQLAALTEEYRIGKAGLALDISDYHHMRDEEFKNGDRFWKIWDWEAQFWQNQLGKTESGDPIYKALIDTTFALYNKRFFDHNQPLDAIRVAGRFTCKHLPWYKNTGLPSDEELYYRRVARFSYYLADNPVE